MENYPDMILRHIIQLENKEHEGYVEIKSKLRFLQGVSNGDSASHTTVATSVVPSSSEPSIKTSVESGRWWQSSKPAYAFTDRKIAQRLQMLTGGVVVDLFDAPYWQMIKRAIQADSLKKQKERIQGRIADEVKRRKMEDAAIDKPDKKILATIEKHPGFRLYQKRRQLRPKVMNVKMMSYMNEREKMKKTSEAGFVSENQDGVSFMITDDELLEHENEDQSIIDQLLGTTVKNRYDIAAELIGPPKSSKIKLL